MISAADDEVFIAIGMTKNRIGTREVKAERDKKRKDKKRVKTHREEE